MRTTILFDFDGVVVDTEPQYDLFWDRVAENYDLRIENFSQVIKGTTLPYIFEKYLSHFSTEVQKEIEQQCMVYEQDMSFPPIAGVLEFIGMLKERKYKIGLVTSSTDAKVKIALEQLDIQCVFDTMVTADRISRGKPDPMGYLLGASDLHSTPQECMVFEDAFAGIEAATRAGMSVIGVSTTNSVVSLQDKVFAVISDFRDIDQIFKYLK